MESKALVEALRQLLDDRKGQDIRVIDLSGRSLFADYFLIVTGTSNRHVSSMAQEVEQYAHQQRLSLLGMEGVQTGDWVLIDLDGVIVHIFRDEVRSFYNLEKLWSPESLSLQAAGGA